MGLIRFFRSIKVKAMVVVMAVSLITTAVFAVLLSIDEENLIRENLQVRGIDIARGLAYNAEYGLLIEDPETLNPLIAAVMRNPEMAYCLIYNVAGEVVSSSVRSDISLREFTVVHEKERESVRTRSLKGPGKRALYEIQVPVVTFEVRIHGDEESLFFGSVDDEQQKGMKEKRVGSVRVGLSFERARQRIMSANKQILAIAAIVTLAVAFFVVLIVEIFVAPIKKLMVGTKEISAGNFGYQVEVASKDEFGELAGAFNNMVTELKKSTVSIDLLEEARKRFEDIAESTGDWIWETDREGQYTYTSSLCEKVLGYKPEEVLGRYFYDFFLPEEREALKQKGLEAFRTEASIRNQETRNVKRNGDVVVLETNAIPVLDRDKRVVGYRGVDRDITVRKRSEEALLENIKLKTDFTSMVSHELRTPLTAIKEGIGIVLDGSAGEINEEQEDFLGTAKRNVDRLTRLINAVLDFTKLEAGKVVLKIKENDVEKLIEEVVHTHTPHATEKGLYIKLEICGELPKIQIDLDRMIQVLTNLVSNAIKFTDKGGITIKAEKDDENVIICVEDTGEGIPEKEIPKLFQEFQQLDDQMKKGTGGTGLGLAISRKIMRQHGGKIWATSEEGKGSIFSFSIPIERKPVILVIEDDEEVVKLYQKILTKAGYRTTTAMTGVDGIRFAQEEIFNLIIMDMKLPDISGYEVIGRLRSDKELAAIPILAVSGYVEELKGLDGITHGPGDSTIPRMSKPFNNEVFLRMVQSLLRRIG